MKSEPMATRSAKEQGKTLPFKRGRWRRVGRAIGVCLSASIFILFAALAMLLGGEKGTRFLIRETLDVYNGLIPGRIAVHEVSGSLLFGLHLEGIRLTGSNGALTIAADSLDLDLNPVFVFERRLHVNSLVIRGAEVHLYTPHIGAAFVDLAPKGLPPTPPSAKEIRPVLPFSLSVQRLAIDGARLVWHEAGLKRPWVAQLRLTLSCSWKGEEASVTITRLAADLPVANLTLRNATLKAGWLAGVATLSAAEFDTSAGAIHIASILFRPHTRTGSLELTATAREEGLAPYVPFPMPGGAVLDLSAKGSFRKLSTQATLTALGTQLQLTAESRLAPSLATSAGFVLYGAELARFGAPVKGKVAGEGSFSLSGSSLDTLKGEARFSCSACSLAPLGKIRLLAKASIAQRNLEGSLDFKSASLSLLAQIKLEQLKTLQAKLNLVANDLAELAKAFALPTMQGRAGAKGSCGGTLPSLACSGQAGVVDFGAYGLHIAQAASTFSAESNGAGRSFAATLTTTALSYDKLKLSRVSIRAKGTPTAMEAVADLNGDKTRVGRVILGIELGPQRKAALRVETLDLALLNAFFEKPSLAGRLDALMTLNGPNSSPVITLQAMAADLSIDGVMIGMSEATFNWDGQRVDLSANLQQAKRTPIRLCAQIPLKLDLARKRVLWLSAEPHHVELIVEELDLSRVNRFVSKPALSGLLSGRLTLDGTPAQPVASMHASTTDLFLEGKRVGTAELEINFAHQLADGWLRFLERDQESLFVSLRVPLSFGVYPFEARAQSARPYQLLWRLRGFTSARLADFVNVPKEWVFSLDGEGRVAGMAPAFYQADLSIHGSVSVGALSDQTLDVQLHAQPDKQQVDVMVGSGSAPPLAVHLDAELPLNNFFSGEPLRNDLPLRAALSAPKISLELLAPFLAGSVHDLSGTASADLRLTGTVNDPSIHGTVAVRADSVSFLKLRNTFEHVDLLLKAEDKHLQLERLTFMSGAGKGNVTGQADFASLRSVEGTADITLKKLLIEVPPLAESVLSSKTALRFSITKNAVNVDVQLKDTVADILLKSSKAPRDIPTNTRIAFVGAEEGDTKAAPKASPSARPILLHFALKNPATLTGQSIQATINGDVTVQLNPQETAVTGQLETSRGSFILMGNTFQIEQATVSFPPGINHEPYLAIVAGADLPDAQVTATIRGRASKPDLKFTSVPPMPDYQILTLLVTGASDMKNPQSGQAESMAANFGTGLVAFQYPELDRQIRQRTGIDRLTLAFGQTTQEPILTAGKRIGRRLYFETSYHYNAPSGLNRAEGRVEFELVKRWYLETFYGDANTGGIDFFWHVPLKSPAK